MAKKADLEAAYVQYDDLCRRTAGAETSRDFPAVLDGAVASLTLLRSALLYQRKHLKIESPPLPTVSRLLRFAPPLFATDSLTRLGEWSAARTKVEKAVCPDLPDRLIEAWERMTAAAAMWSALGTPVAVPPPAPGVAESVVEVWLAAGLVVRKDRSRLTVVTDMGRAAEGKCSGCGGIHRTTAAAFLDPLACPHCGRRREFVITRRLL